MELRIRKNYYKGYFRKLNNGNLVKKSIPVKKRKNTTLNSIVKRDLNCLNYLILKKLTSSKRSVFRHDRMEPAKVTVKYLIDNYQISNKYTNCTRLLTDHNLTVERYHNEYDYCSIYDKSFEMKLMKSRKLKYLNKNLEIKEVKYKDILLIKFTQDDNKIILF